MPTTTPKITTTLTFETIDMRGRRGFPADHRGFVYVHYEDRELPERHTGLTRRQRRAWGVRHGAPELAWRVDRHGGFGLWAVGVRGEWKTSEAAASPREPVAAASWSDPAQPRAADMMRPSRMVPSRIASPRSRGGNGA